MVFVIFGLILFIFENYATILHVILGEVQALLASHTFFLFGWSQFLQNCELSLARQPHNHLHSGGVPPSGWPKIRSIGNLISLPSIILAGEQPVEFGWRATGWITISWAISHYKEGNLQIPCSWSANFASCVSRVRLNLCTMPSDCGWYRVFLVFLTSSSWHISANYK